MGNNKEKRNADGLTEAEFLAAYNPGDYERPSVTVDMMVLRMKPELDGRQILLIQRKNHPFIEHWALAGGFVDIDESAYHAACRELKEETGITGVYLEQIYTMSQPDRDPRMRVIDIAYAALLPYGEEVEAVAGDDAADALWFDIEFTDERLKLSNSQKGIVLDYKLNAKEFVNGRIRIKNLVPELVSEDALACDHAEIILEGLNRIRNKVMYTDVAFNLVPEKFTLPDLQKVYEVILGKPLYKANFREKIEGNVTELAEKGKTITTKRMSRLYEYKV